MADQNAGWEWATALFTGLGSVAALLGWSTGRGALLARARREETRESAEFERFLNERASFVLKAYESKIKELTEEVETLRKTVAYMEAMLETTTKKLQELEAHLDLVTKKGTK